MMGIIIAFDTDLTKQKAGLVIRKDALDKFLDIKKLHLVWFVNAAKEIHGKTLMITKYTDWTGLLEYTGDIVQGEYYIIESQQRERQGKFHLEMKIRSIKVRIESVIVDEGGQVSVFFY